MLHWLNQKFLSPKLFYSTTTLLLPWLVIAFVICFTFGIIDGLFIAPADYQQGDGFRIIYVHVPSAFTAMAIYLVMAVSALLVLVWRIKIAAICMSASAKIGAWFTFLALVTGSIWGKPMWGTWWIWDARLTSELILLFLYTGIILFQSAVSQKKSGERTTAILILIGFVDIPIIHYSVYWWNTLHQGATLTLFKRPAIDSSMLYPLLSMIVAFLIYYAIVLLLRMRYDIIAVHANQHWLITAERTS